MKRKFLRFGVIALTAMLFSTPAFATNKISSPDVTRGQVQLEYRGGYDWDEQNSKDGVEGHKFVANYGLTDRWRIEGKLSASGKSDDVDWTYAEASLRYQFFKEGESWLRAAVQANYKASLIEARPDVLELALLAQKDTGPFTHTLNLNAVQETGALATGGPSPNFNWKTKYNYDPHFQPGAEFYADIGKIGETSTVSPDKYQIGPAFYGKIGDVSYDAGFLFGLNRNVPDGRAKLILTYSF